jgi:hypothetical protein
MMRSVITKYTPGSKTSKTRAFVHVTKTRTNCLNADGYTIDPNHFQDAFFLEYPSGKHGVGSSTFWGYEYGLYVRDAFGKRRRLRF